ncbi:hypothetical protein F5144DRAFT_486627 [Chaetomium tenue]|uniref:Uncharacterized protein n=1 Tax=Chaetomium tenue TaxID=1854479 RepID=A0ACB7PAE2_9PEZI|nr:hypothetical protein F5144DRAFT_486627 [Chaetomium globosum]
MATLALLLRRGFGTSGKAIAGRGGFQLPLRGQKGASIFFSGSRPSLAVHQRDNMRTAVSPRSNFIPRWFHASAPGRSSCDFGGPCDCSECRESARRPFCDICKVNPTVHQSADSTHDRKGMRGYNFTSFCGPCWERREEQEKQRRQAKERSLATRREKLSNMTRAIKRLPPGEQLPVDYAVQRFLNETRGMGYAQNSHRWHREYLCRELSEELRIVKVRRRYMCDKGRVDAMDFKLWLFNRRLDVDV